MIARIVANNVSSDGRIESVNVSRKPAMIARKPADDCEQLQLTSSTLPQVSLTGLHHFSLAAYGLPHPCLRLTPVVTGSRLKTRYEMGWVGPFSVALSATSEPAPRGALAG